MLIAKDEARHPRTTGKKKKRQDTDTLTDNQHKLQDPHGLTWRQRRFVQEYVKDSNASRAYQAAGGDGIITVLIETLTVFDHPLLP